MEASEETLRILLGPSGTGEHHRVNGHKYGYPECCIDQFVAEIVLGIKVGRHRGAFVERANGQRYVPCDACLQELRLGPAQSGLTLHERPSA